MNTGLIIGIISLSLVSIVAVVVVVIRMNKKTTTSTVGPTSGPTVGPTSEPTITRNKVLTKTQVPTKTLVPPNNYTKLYEYPSGISANGYRATYAPAADAYSLLNTSPYNITKVGFNFMTNYPRSFGLWLYKLDKNKIASPSTTWTTIFPESSENKLYIQNILIEPGESFVIDMKQLRYSTATFQIMFVEVLLPGLPSSGPSSGPSSDPKNKGDTLRVGQFLLEEDYLQNGNHTVTLGGLNNRLILSNGALASGYDLNPSAVGVKLLMQPDGILVILDKDGDACWATYDGFWSWGSSSGYFPSPNTPAQILPNDTTTRLFLQSTDGNLALYNSRDEKTWVTRKLS